MNLLVDIDGVVADLHTAWFARYNRDWNDSLTSEDVTSWGAHEFVKPECGLKIYDYLRQPDMYDDVKPIKGALKNISRLRDDGHRITFVSSGLYSGKIKWLHEHGFMIGDYMLWEEAPDFVIANDKSLIKGDILIDDKYKNVQDFFPQSILFDQPWNRDGWWRYRAFSWDAVYNIISLVLAP